MKNNILEGNKLIAQFYTDEPEVLVNDLKRAGTLESMHYHDQWDWLIPVINKISNTEELHPYFDFFELTSRVKAIFGSLYVDPRNVGRVHTEIVAFLSYVNSKPVERFPNGFDSWQETHYIISKEIIIREDYVLDTFCNDTGTGGLYELAKELTDKFELIHKGKEWGIDDDTQYFDAMSEFIVKELYDKRPS